MPRFKHDEEPIGKHARHAASYEIDFEMVDKQGVNADRNQLRSDQEVNLSNTDIETSNIRQDLYSNHRDSMPAIQMSTSEHNEQLNDRINDTSKYRNGAQSFVDPRIQTNRKDELLRLRNINKKQKKWPIVVGIIVALFIVLCIVGLCAFNSVRTLKADASAVMAEANEIQGFIKSSDYSSAAISAKKLQSTAKEMNNELSSPLWSVASTLPVVGNDVNGVKTIASILDDAATNALVPLTDTLASNPPSDLVQDGVINVNSVDTLLGSVEGAAPVMQRCADQLNDLPDMNIEQLQSAIEPAKEKITSINNLFQQASKFAPLISSFLGADGSRTYLIVAQNVAEMRASDGFPGSMGILTITNGAIELHDFGSVYQVMPETTPDTVAQTPEEQSLFMGALSKPWDASFNADYPRTAEIWSTSYTTQTGTSIDGVISITPSVVQKLLAITGPITLVDGTQLDGSNATKILQHDLYWKYLSSANASPENAALADLLFADAADKAFKGLLSNMNANSMMAFAGVFADCMDTREIMLYLNAPDEQALLKEAGITGELNNNPETPELGVFFDLWIGSKMGWYVDIDTTVSEGVKQVNGSTSYKVTTVLRNTADPNDVEAGGAYIMGTAEGYQNGDMAPLTYFYAPAGGSITDFTMSSGSFSKAAYEGFEVYRTDQPNLLPGQSITCTYTVNTAPNAQEPLTVITNPTLTEYR